MVSKVRPPRREVVSRGASGYQPLSMSTLAQLLKDRAADAAKVEQHLEALPADARLQQVLALGPRAQARLFELVQGHRALTLERLTPKKGPLEPVAHEGRNTLPAFRYFAKVFCRPDDGSDERWGYNRNPPLVYQTVGPGYFVAVTHGPNEVLVDYTLTPPRKPAAWPPIAHKHAKLSRFVFFGTQDVLRGVSEHVSIGRARRQGRWMDNWFILCRT